MIKLPGKYRQLLFSALLSIFMSLIVSGVSTGMIMGVSTDFMVAWGRAWLSSWLIAFPAILVISPLVKNLLPLFIEEDTER